MLSVVVPTHNVRDWVGETLATISDQHLDGLEIIVVDDHSSDGTREVVEAWADFDARIRLIDAIDFGGANARNLGVRHARGRYLAFCDGDDLVPPGAYKAMVDSLESSGSDIVFGDYLKFSTMKTWRPTERWNAYQEQRVAVSLRDHPSLIRGRACWNKVFRRDFWDSTGASFPEVARSNDIVPMMTTYLAARSIDVIDDVVYLYRARPGASSMTAKARSAVALVSYLEQELTCASLVSTDGDHGLLSMFAGLFFEADGWKHLNEFLATGDSDPELDARIAELLSEIRKLLPEFRFGRLNPVRRAVFNMASAGSVRAASAFVRATTAGQVQDATSVDMWREVFAALGDIPESHAVVRASIPALAHAVRSPDVEISDLMPVIRIAAQVAMADSWQPLDRVPELSQALGASDERLRDRIESSRNAGHRLEAVALHRGHVTVFGSSAVPGLRLRLRAASRSLQARPISIRPASDTTGERFAWSAEITATGLRPGSRAYLVAESPLESGGSLQVELPTSTQVSAEYDRFGSLDVGRTGDGALWIERRHHWTIRGARRARNNLLSRFQRRAD
ncbi:glycosyltransferase [Agromyces sp. SYSU K20354]|uniref:glycosyltransferase family 2 protein n=1 Tax=Agromyces cavernae TaxID=2898659 RepID=UPI001E3ADC6D|nr:glycosyltransferase family 2 protein [Agromyces cavernae]MCD2444036.1 glycosyltransferase [Agromyces cavernae]